MMKPFYYYFLAICLCLTACEKEDENNSVKTNSLTITETTGLGSEKVTIEQQFIYQNGALTKRITTQTYTDLLQVEQYTLIQTTLLTYDTHKVTVTDESGNISIYDLNDEGVAVSCTRNEPTGYVRTYAFSYSAPQNGMLSGIKETINGKVCSEITLLHAEDNSIIHIIEKTDDFQNSYAATTNDNNPGILNTGNLPWPFLTERYPLSFHIDAFYAHILGTPFKTLPGQLDVDNSNEVISYSYATNKDGYITSYREKNSAASQQRTVEYAYSFE